MLSEKPMPPCSLNPHRAIVTMMIVLGGSVLFGMVVGWQWYFDNSNRREAIMEFAAAREAELKLKADASAAIELREVAPPLAPVDNSPRASLADMARESRKDASITELPRQTVTITLPLDPASPDVQQADELLQQYASAKTWQEKLPYVYQPEGTRLLMEQFYEMQKGSDPISGALLNRGHYRLDGTEILHYTYSCNRPGDVLELAMRRNSDGRFVLDWTSYVGFSQIGWDQFKKERVTTPILFRAFATSSDYYNYEFTDRTKFLSVNLLSADGLVSLHGFCERDSPMGSALATALSRTGTMSGIVVRLAFPVKAESDHCVWIRQFVSDRWLLLP